MKSAKPTAVRGRRVNAQARLERTHQILDGARVCFIRRGFHGSSMAEISAAAGVSIANLYQYYASKDALIIALIDQDLRRHVRMLDRIACTDFSAKSIYASLEDLFTTTAGHEVAVLRAEISSECSRNPEVAELLRKSEAEMTELFIKSIRASKHSVPDERAVNFSDIVEVLALTFEGAMRNYVISPDEGAHILDRLSKIMERAFTSV